jgi:FkbM family methyltransferase
VNLRRFLGRLTGTHIFRRLPRGVDLAADLARWVPDFQARVVFDVGAHHGQSTERFLDWFPKARVYCFEPVSVTYATLLGRFADQPRVRCVPLALGARVGEATIPLEGPSDMYALDTSSGAGPGATERVSIDTVDTYTAREGIGRISLLKVDTEGHDLAVLEGAESLLGRNAVDLIQVEAGWHPENLRHVRAEVLKAHLESRGYRLFALYNQKEEWTTGDPWLRRADLVFVRSGIGSL